MFRYTQRQYRDVELRSRTKLLVLDHLCAIVLAESGDRGTGTDFYSRSGRNLGISQTQHYV